MKEIPEELLPVIEWWEKNGKQAIVTVVVAAVVAAGYYGFKSHQESQRKAASSALVSSRTLAQLETASNEFGGSKAGPSIKLRLAKEYYDAGQYESAMNLYKELSGKAPEGFAEAPAVGIAYCLEATEKYDEAAKAFEACAQDEKSLYFLTAKLGVARCTAAAGDKAKALADLEALKDCEPIYEEMPGWQCETSHITDYSELPENAKKYINRILEICGAKLGVLSVGPARETTLRINI